MQQFVSIWSDILLDQFFKVSDDLQKTREFAATSAFIAAGIAAFSAITAKWCVLAVSSSYFAVDANDYDVDVDDDNDDRLTPLVVNIIDVTNVFHVIIFLPRFYVFLVFVFSTFLFIFKKIRLSKI